jgi:hypothetical protein
VGGYSLQFKLNQTSHPILDYVNTFSQCWVDTKYDTFRLWLHYIWLFLNLFGGIFVYMSVYITLLRRLNIGNGLSGYPARWYPPWSSPRTTTTFSGRYIIGFPVLYLFCALPLAIGQLLATSGHQLPNRFNYAAACLAASCGWIHAVYYLCFLRNILFALEGRPSHASSPTHVVSTKIPGMTTTLTGNSKLCRGPDAQRSAGHTEQWNRNAVSVYRLRNVTENPMLAHHYGAGDGRLQQLEDDMHNAFAAQLWVVTQAKRAFETESMR